MPIVGPRESAGAAGGHGPAESGDRRFGSAVEIVGETVGLGLYFDDGFDRLVDAFEKAFKMGIGRVGKVPDERITLSVVSGNPLSRHFNMA